MILSSSRLNFFCRVRFQMANARKQIGFLPVLGSCHGKMGRMNTRVNRNVCVTRDWSTQ